MKQRYFWSFFRTVRLYLQITIIVENLICKKLLMKPCWSAGARLQTSSATWHGLDHHLLFRTLGGPYTIVHVSRNLLAGFLTQGVDRFCSDWAQNDRNDVNVFTVKRFCQNIVLLKRRYSLKWRNAVFGAKTNWMKHLSVQPVNWNTDFRHFYNALHILTRLMTTCEFLNQRSISMATCRIVKIAGVTKCKELTDFARSGLQITAMIWTCLLWSVCAKILCCWNVVIHWSEKTPFSEQKLTAWNILASNQLTEIQTLDTLTTHNTYLLVWWLHHNFWINVMFL